MPDFLPSIPTDDDAIRSAVWRSQRHVARQALLSAGATFVPIPGVDMLVDISVMIKMLDRINREFGLTPEQIDELPSQERLMVYEAINWVGTVLAGKIISSQMAVTLLKSVGVKVSSKQVARWVPLVGQATAAALGYAALRYLGQAHIKDCERVAREVAKRLDAPDQTKK